MSVNRTPPKRQTSNNFDKDLDDLCNTLDKSRKRHLSVGLLRGDQVHDRLKVQEASASPLLKKSKAGQLTPPREEMAMTLADFKAYMDPQVAATNQRLDNIDGKVSGLQAAVSKVDNTVQLHSAKLDRHEATIKASPTQG